MSSSIEATKVALKRLRQIAEDQRLFVLRDQSNLPESIQRVIEEQIKAIQEGDMRNRIPGLGDYFQAVGHHDKWWVSTEVDGVSLADGEIPKTRMSVIKDLFYAAKI